MAFQKTIILGNLGRDPELSTTKNNMKICKFSVAVSEKLKRNDEWTEETEWFSVITFGVTAENCAKYLSKGSQVFIDGKLKTSKWEKDGQKHQRTELIASNVQFVGKKETQNDNAESTSYSKFNETKQSDDSYEEDDIPF